MRASFFLKLTAILMVVLTVFTLASCALTDAASEEETTTEPEVVTMEARPTDNAQILDFYNRAVNNIKAQNPGVSCTKSGSVRDVDTGDTPEAKAMIQFAKSFSDALNKQSETKEYGEDLTDFMPLKGSPVVSRLTEADIATIEMTDVEDDRYSYDIHIVLNDSDKTGAVANAFDMDLEKSDILNTFTDYKDTVEVSDYEVSFNGCEIFARINKETNQVTSLRLVKNNVVTADVNFCGTLADLGETPVTFNYAQELNFSDFVWEEPTEAEPAE